MQKLKLLPWFVLSLAACSAEGEAPPAESQSPPSAELNWGDEVELEGECEDCEAPPADPDDPMLEEALEASEELVESAPMAAILADPSCSTGIKNGDACCAKSCGTCGGTGCSGRPGGSSACCTGPILKSSATCSGSLPPCKLTASKLYDAQGVQMLHPSLSGGPSLVLGNSDPNSLSGLTIEKGTRASKKTEGGLTFWRLPSYELNYSSGGTGKTSRLHLFASGGSQKYTWKTQKGFLAQASDVKNLEFTGYFRARGIFDAGRAAINMKVRGGKHTKDNGDLASCVAFGVYPGTARDYVVRFAKELHHPDYDYKVITPDFDFKMKEGAWFGMKLVSYNVPGKTGEVLHTLYIDADPFDSTGKPKNGWRKYASYRDVDGEKFSSKARYSKSVTWGGHQNSIRTDGMNELDFLWVGIREIQVPG